MKKFNLFIAAVVAVTLVSCKPVSDLQRDASYMQIRFKPLTRSDVTLVGNLSTEVTITGKGSALDKSFQSNLKVGRNYIERTDILYFSPGQGEVITGSLFDGSVFEFAKTNTSESRKKQSLFEMFFPKLAAAKKAAAPLRPVDFAFYALIEKYPDVDYFINVRFDKKHILSGTSSKWTETVIVKADGVKLKTD
jgi:hypothetical protein